MKNAGLSSVVIAAVLLAVGAIAERSSRRKSRGSGFYRGSTELLSPPVPEGIRLALRERGHIEGQNIAIEYRYAEGKRSRLLDFRPSWCVSRLISSWCRRDGSFRAAMNATKTIPIVSSSTKR